MTEQAVRLPGTRIGRGVLPFVAFRDIAVIEANAAVNDLWSYILCNGLLLIGWFVPEVFDAHCSLPAITAASLASLTLFGTSTRKSWLSGIGSECTGESL